MGALTQTRRYGSLQRVMLAFFTASFAAEVAYWAAMTVIASARMSLSENIEALVMAWPMFIVCQGVAAVPIILIKPLRCSIEQSLIRALAIGILVALLIGGFFAWLMSGMVDGSAKNSLLPIAIMWLVTGAASGGVFHLLATRKTYLE